jgi:membrane peptidoglycan carboxypeptidase
VVGAVLAVTVVGVNVYAVGFMNSLPNVHGLDASAFQGDTIVYDRNGNLLADVGSQSAGDEGNQRSYVPYDQVSPFLVQATVAVEDRTFWTNPGYDLGAIVRAALSNSRSGGITSGASTITQQLAKQLFLTPKQSITRKVQEIALASQLNQAYSKKQIMELYLNRNYYGEQQYGVQAASKTYFHKNAKDLDLAQSAMLAGLPQSPDAYSPVTHFEAARVRQHEVLEAMVREHDISPAQETAAYAENLQPVGTPSSNWKAPQFVTYVLNELRQLGYAPGQQQLTVTTTLDLGKQQIGEQLVRENRDANAGKDPALNEQVNPQSGSTTGQLCSSGPNCKSVPGHLQSSLVSLDPATGQILAYVGSADPKDQQGGQYDFVSQVPINPGSSLKPFTYASAIRDRKLTMETPIADNPSPYVVTMPGSGPWKVYNYDKGTHGNPPAKIALASSLNIPAVKVELTEGVPTVVDTQRSLGLRPRLPRTDGTYTTDDSDTSFGPSLTLGGYPITLLEEAGAYEVLEQEGTYHRPESILKVLDATGKQTYAADASRGAHPVLDPGVAFIIDSILNDDNNRAPIFGHGSPLHLPDRNSMAKTGTTEDNRDGVTAGFTPDLVTVVWIGDIVSINHHFVGGRADAVYTAAPLWNKYMEQVLKGLKDRWLNAPQGLIHQGSDYFLGDTPKVDHMPGDNPSPSPSPTDNGVPPDPGTGPVPAGKPCVPLPKPFPPCPPPTP